jgi:hypothetical protein
MLPSSDPSQSPETDAGLQRQRIHPEGLKLQHASLTSSVSLPTISRTVNSLSKVLFIFPSRYLFAIGLSPIFSFRWNLPPTLSCIPKQLDSSKVYHKAPEIQTTDGAVTHRALYSNRLRSGPARKTLLEITTRTPKAPDYKFELFPLHSPLLGESWLVSFPPLIDMLKFSG